MSVKLEKAMLDARDRRNDYGSTKSYKRKFTKWCKRQLARASRRLNNRDAVAWCG